MSMKMDKLSTKESHRPLLCRGNDVTGGRYNQINNNLSAKAVKTAEIMENYQSVKALKGKINSEEVALNLKLDPKARDQWIANTTLGAGWSDDNDKLLWEGGLNALQLGKGKQSVYNYKTNNNGKDLSNEQTILTGSGWQEVPLSGFLHSRASVHRWIKNAYCLMRRTP